MSETKSAPQDSQRLFFALWPDEGLQRRFDALAGAVADRVQGRRIHAGSLHVTVLFLGQLDLTERACAEAVADRLQGAAFTLVMDRLGYFRRPQVIWLGAESPRPLAELVQALRAGITQCRIECDDRPFQSHLTLMRKARRPCPPLTFDPISWEVTHFDLVLSKTTPEGSEYTVVKSWPLPVPDISHGNH